MVRIGKSMCGRSSMLCALGQSAARTLHPYARVGAKSLQPDPSQIAFALIRPLSFWHSGESAYIKLTFWWKEDCRSLE